MSADEPNKLEGLGELFRRAGIGSLSSPGGTYTSTGDSLVSLANILSSTSSAPQIPPPPPVIKDRWFKGQTINLDGYVFEKCRFDNCRLVTKTATFALRNCFVDQTSKVLFDGPALKSVRLLMHLLDSRAVFPIKSGTPAFTPVAIPTVPSLWNKWVQLGTQDSLPRCSASRPSWLPESWLLSGSCK